MAASVPLNTRVEPDLKSVLLKQARERGMSLSDHVRDLLRRGSGLVDSEESAGFRHGRMAASRQVRGAFSRAFHSVSKELNADDEG